MYYHDNMYEGYLDNNQEYYDYGTAVITGNDIIDTNHTGMSYYDEFLDPSKKEYLTSKKNLVGDIVYMSPTEYYKRCAQQFNTSVSHLISSREADKNTLDKLRNVIKVYRRKFCLPMINYADNGQEGLHRMYIVGELLGWDHEVPVLVVDWYDKELAEKKKQEAKKHKIDARVEHAIKKTLEYRYRTIDEVPDQLQWELDRSFEFVDDVETPVTFEFKKLENSIIIKVFGYEYPIEIESIKFIENKEDSNDDFMLDDVDNIDDWLVKYLGDNWSDEYPDAKKKIEHNS